MSVYNTAGTVTTGTLLPYMTRQQAQALRTDPKYWKLGIVYVCKEDPRATVRNRWIFGWTWNFGNWLTLLLLPLSVLFFLAPLFLATSYGRSQTEIVAVGGVTLMFLLCAAHYVATGPR